MIFPKDFENKTGFAHIREVVADKCDTRLGKEETYAMSFSSINETVMHRLRCVSEMVGLLSNNRLPASGGIYDVVPWLVEIKVEGSYMSAERLSRLASTLHVMQDIYGFFSDSSKEEGPDFPALKTEFSQIISFPTLEKEISSCVGKFGEVIDNASPALYEIRREMSAASGSMQRAMKKVIESAVKNGLVDSDVSPSMRDGRLVLPVSASMKKSINGIVHDQSATGKTIFIEPYEVVEAGNRLRRLELEERQEVVRILKSIADAIRPHIDEIIESCKLLGRLDFIKAKAYFAMDTGGEMPTIEEKREIEWYHAVHPGLLLTLRQSGKIPVPLNITLGGDKRILIISGPNAGGKSVTLKTVAVVQYMMQCGLLPTLHSNSHMGIFSNIFIDIGDEQSIENDLSTYSSHLNNMKFFINNSGKGTLVLADEMGSGTEPQIGGALAQAILADLGKKGCMGVITTHYQNLKTFADAEEGFVNGAMLYDRQHLRPTFQLSIGNPGSSFALEIARNTGLPSSVIEKAKEIVGSDYVDIDKYLLDIQRDRRYWQNKRLNIKEKEHKLDKLLEAYEANASELKSQRSQILKNAKDEAKEILSQANARIERSIHEIRKAEAERNKTLQVRKELEEYKESLEKDSSPNDEPAVLKPLKHKSNKSKGEKKTSSNKSVESNVPLEIGDVVKMNGGGVTGKVLAIKDKKVEVAFGGLRTIVEISKLSKVQSSPQEQKAKISLISQPSVDSGSRERQLNFKNEIDVRGMKADEALQAVTYFIDDALQFNIGKVRILHGTGFGILRTIIREYLQSHPGVSSFKDEDVRFGGAGITVVELD